MAKGKKPQHGSNNGLKLNGHQLEQKRNQAGVLISAWQATVTATQEYGCPERLKRFNDFMTSQRSAGLTIEHLGLTNEKKDSIKAATQFYKHNKKQRA